MSDGGAGADSGLYRCLTVHPPSTTPPTTTAVAAAAAAASSAASSAAVSIAVESSSLKDKFSAKLDEFLRTNLDNKRSSVMSDQRYRELIAETKEAKRKKLRGEALTAKQHRRFKRFDVLSTTTTNNGLTTEGGNICCKVERLIDRNSITSGDNVKFFCPAGELYDIIHSTHISMGHKREKSMEMELKRKYCNVTRVLIKMYLELCPRCQLKRETRAPRVKKPSMQLNAAYHSWDSNPQSSSSGRESDASECNIMSELNYRCQADLVDMQMEPDGDYRFILNYHDFLTKFVILRPLKTKTAEEVAYHLIDVFCLIGAPCILHSDHGREFCNRVIKNLSNWSNIKLVNGKPPKINSQIKQLQSNWSECTNQEVRDNLITWMANEKTTKWSEGLKFVQSSMNRSYNRAIRRSPYEALFGMPQRNGLLDTYLPKNIVQELQTEEDLEEALASQGMTVQQLLPTDTRSSVSVAGALKEKEADNNQQQPSVLCVVCQKQETSRINSSCSSCKHPVHAMCATQTHDEVDDQGFGGGGGGAAAAADALSVVLCFLCTRKRNIDIVRKGCKRSLVEVNDAGLPIHAPPPPPLNKKFPLVATTTPHMTNTTATTTTTITTRTMTTTLAPVPADLDRGRLAPRNFMSGGASNISDVGIFTQPMTASSTIGSTDGYLDCYYARNEFPTADSNFMQMAQEIHVAGVTNNNIKAASVVHSNMQTPSTTATTTTTTPTTCSAGSSTQGFVIRCNCRIHCNDKKCSCRKNNVKCNAKCHGSATCANK